MIRSPASAIWVMTMSDEQALAQVQELEEIVSQLDAARARVNEFSIATYEYAGAALWAGQRRTRFAVAFEEARSHYGQISEQIGQAIGDCKSRQRTLALSINPIEHPALSAQALWIALN